jgi:hypothetical protein
VTCHKLSKAEFTANDRELDLAEEVVDFFLDKWLDKGHALEVKNRPRSEKLNLFRWENYLVARCWIFLPGPLAATLELRKVFPPWWKNKNPTSQ